MVHERDEHSKERKVFPTEVRPVWASGRANFSRKLIVFFRMPGPRKTNDLQGQAHSQDPVECKRAKCSRRSSRMWYGAYHGSSE